MLHGVDRFLVFRAEVAVVEQKRAENRIFETWAEIKKPL